MESNEYEKRVRAALRDYKHRDLISSISGPKTSVYFCVRVDGKLVAGLGETVCDPGDEYDERVGYEIALERAIKNAVAFYADRERRRKAVAMPKPKRAVALNHANNGPGSYWLWCDDDIAGRVFAIPGVRKEARSSGEDKWYNGAYMIYIDNPRYDRDEVIAAIEAAGGE